MEPNEFEHFVAELFRKRGYAVLVTPQSGDFGADLVVESELARVAVQIKHYGQENKVGVTDITHLIGAKHYYRCDAALIITTSSFTNAAIDMAEKSGVRIWDGEVLDQYATETGFRPIVAWGSKGLIPCSPETLVTLVRQYLADSSATAPANLFFGRPLAFEIAALCAEAAERTGFRIHSHNAESLERPVDLVAVMSSLEAGDIFLIDNLEYLKHRTLQCLLETLQNDYTVEIVVGSGPDAKVIKLPVNPFSFFAASSQAKKIKPAVLAVFHGRFQIEEGLKAPTALEQFAMWSLSQIVKPRLEVERAFLEVSKTYMGDDGAELIGLVLQHLAERRPNS